MKIIKERLLNVSKDYDSCRLYFLSLISMYVPSLISIPFVLSKIWPGQASIKKKYYEKMVMGR